MPVSAIDQKRVAAGELAFQGVPWRRMRLEEAERSARAIPGGGLSQSTRAIAYHEAGHAVAAAWFRCSFDYVTVRADGLMLGYIAGPIIGGTELEYISIIHAGAEAQKRLGAAYYSAKGAIPDLDAVRAAWTRHAGRAPSSDQSRELQIEAAGLVALLWPRIQRVAVTLEKRLTLSLAEVYSLCGESRVLHCPAPIEKRFGRSGRSGRTDDTRVDALRRTNESSGAGGCRLDEFGTCAVA